MTTKTIPCHWCGQQIPENIREHRDQVGHTHCSRECKWIAVFHWDCSRKGERPKVPGSWGWSILQVYRRDQGKCKLCGKPMEITDSDLEFHHLLPIAVGGNSLPENVVMLCSDCHAKVHRSLRAKSTTSQNTLKKYLTPKLNQFEEG